MFSLSAKMNTQIPCFPCAVATLFFHRTFPSTYIIYSHQGNPTKFFFKLVYFNVHMAQNADGANYAYY